MPKISLKHFYKKFFCFLLIFITPVIFLEKDALPAPSNGSRMPPKGRPEVGYEYNVMFGRTLDRSYGTAKTQDYFLTLSIGIFDWLSFDGKIGFGDITVASSSHLPRLEFNTGFAGGYGFRIKAYENKKLDLKCIIGFQHISVHPQNRSAGDDKYESFLDDWQISGIVSKRIKFMNPYLGIKGSDCEFVYKINKHDKKRRYSRYHIGLIFGSDFFFMDDKVRINVEGRLFDETALSACVAYLY